MLHSTDSLSMSSVIWEAQAALHDVYTDTEKILVMYDVLDGVTG